MPVVIEPEVQPGLTFGEMQEEVYAAGFDDLKSNAAEVARVKRWLNIAYREVCDYQGQPWPWLEAEIQELAPMTIANVGHVLSVTDSTHDEQLRYADRRELIRLDPDLSGTGIAERWYMEGEDSLNVYPANASSTFLVRYTVLPADLKEDSDLCLVPRIYQQMIVEGAILRAYKNRDNYDAAKIVREEWRFGMENMVRALIKRNYDRERSVLRTGRPGDYL